MSDDDRILLDRFHKMKSGEALVVYIPTTAERTELARLGTAPPNVIVRTLEEVRPYIDKLGASDVNSPGLRQGDA